MHLQVRIIVREISAISINTDEKKEIVYDDWLNSRD